MNHVLCVCISGCKGRDFFDRLYRGWGIFASKKEIQETALSLMKEYNTDEIIKISVGSERVYSNS